MTRARSKRMFGQPRPRWRLRLLHVGIAVAALAACAPRTETWSPSESPKRNLVSWTEFHHAVAFVPGSATLTQSESQALEQFVGRLARGEGVRVSLAASGSDPTLAVRRETAIAAWFRERGVQAQLGAAPVGVRADAVRVTVGRHVVTLPNCPDWTKPADGNPSNTVSSNFGCATTRNLGLMVADPGALVRGYEMGPADGEAMAKGIQDYREGTAPWLPSSTFRRVDGSTAKGGDGN